MTSTANERRTRIPNVQARDVIPYMLLSFGLASLLLSAFYSSYVLAFIGLGLTFWGTLFVYIKFTKYVKLELLTATSSSNLDNIERILATTETSQKGVYLPPKKLKDATSSLIFIPSEPNQTLPASVGTTQHGSQSGNPTGLLMTPPGLALSRLFEKELKRLFTETTMEDLQKQLPQVFEKLQITKSLYIAAQPTMVTVTIGNHIFKDLCEETKKLEKTHLTVGSPLSSALACVFAKSTGKPVTIQKEETSSEGTTTIEYNILEN